MKQALVMVAMLAGACSSGPKDAGFGDVQRELAGRLPQRVQWDRGGPEDAEAAREVDELLAQPMSVDAAVQVALLNNRRLRATYEDLGVAQADLVRAGLLRNPVFDAEVRFVEAGGGEVVELSITQEFLDILAIPLKKKVAAAALEAAKARVAGEVVALAGEVRRAAYDSQAAVQLVELRRGALAAGEAAADLTERLHAAGNVTDLALNRERAAREAARLALAEAELAAVEARERLGGLMGVWGPRAATWAVKPKLAELPQPPEGDGVGENFESRAVERSLDLAALRYEADAASRAAGLARPVALLEGLDVGASAEREEDGAWAVGPAVAIPIPLFDTGSSTKAKAAARWRQARETYAAAAVEVRSAARLAWARLAAAQARAAYHRDTLVPLQRDITAHTQRQYNAMQVGAFDLLSAKQAEIDAEAASVRALHGYWLARTDAEQLLAGRAPAATPMAFAAPANIDTESEGH